MQMQQEMWGSNLEEAGKKGQGALASQRGRKVTGLEGLSLRINRICSDDKQVTVIMPTSL